MRIAVQVEVSEAAKAAWEAMASYERLAERLPLAFTHDLRGALGTLAEVLDQLGRDEEAGRIRKRANQLGEYG
ncbi:MAG TPA: hypothetical protein VHH34_14295 [Pseudonocardiaceae bacterium]|nr:hypothetical protein [Pseudonocardiaceae bacterium]